MATTPTAQAEEQLQAGRAALAEGNWEEARRCIEAARPNRDASRAYRARLGLQSEALATLETLLSIPFYVSPAWLQLDANFAGLRGSPGSLG